MASDQKQVSFTVSSQEKQQIREAAAEAGLSMSAFARRKVLNDLTVPEEPPEPDEYTPLEDFIASQLAVDEDATPVPKAHVHDRYVEFCAEEYPEHDPETQHKLSRELLMTEGVDQGRWYINKEQRRCFLNLRFRNEIDGGF